MNFHDQPARRERAAPVMRCVMVQCAMVRGR
jgi:hypothetical protein